MLFRGFLCFSFHVDHSLDVLLAVPKPGPLQFLRRSALLRPFALFCALLRSFALFFVLAFALFFLRATAFRTTLVANLRYSSLQSLLGLESLHAIRRLKPPYLRRLMVRLSEDVSGVVLADKPTNG